MESADKASRRVLTSGSLVSVLSLAVLASLTACSGPGGSSGTTVEVGLSSHSQPVSPAPPGKYQTLPEPCGTLDGNALRSLLPNSSNYAGDATPTYDIDRRVGCTWSGSVAGGSRILSIDLERVVSYDPTVSDNDRAAQDFAQLAAVAHISPISPSSPQSASASTPQSPSSVQPTSPAPSPAAPGASPSFSASPLASSGSGTGTGNATPRRVGDIGDEAYLDDSLVTEDADIHRDVTVVFRTANVLVTVVLSQWSANDTAIPPSAELQSGADGIAQQVARQFD